MDKKLIHKRLIAYILDILVIYILIQLIISIKGLNPLYNKYIKEYNEYSATMENYLKEDNYDLKTINKSINKSVYYLTRYSIYNNAVIIVCVIGYFVFFQKYNNGQTLGKKITKIKVTDLDNNNPSILSYIKKVFFNYFFYIGNLIPIILNTILSYTVNISVFAIINNIITYGYLLIGIISFIMLHTRKDNKTISDMIAKTIVVNE